MQNSHGCLFKFFLPRQVIVPLSRRVRPSPFQPCLPFPVQTELRCPRALFSPTFQRRFAIHSLTFPPPVPSVSCRYFCATPHLFVRPVLIEEPCSGISSPFSSGLYVPESYIPFPQNTARSSFSLPPRFVVFLLLWFFWDRGIESVSRSLDLVCFPAPREPGRQIHVNTPPDLPLLLFLLKITFSVVFVLPARK